MLTTLEGLMGGPEMARCESVGLHYDIINSVHLIGALGSAGVKTFSFHYFFTLVLSLLLNSTIFFLNERRDIEMNNVS